MQTVPIRRMCPTNITRAGTHLDIGNVQQWKQRRDGCLLCQSGGVSTTVYSTNIVAVCPETYSEVLCPNNLLGLPAIFLGERVEILYNDVHQYVPRKSIQLKDTGLSTGTYLKVGDVHEVLTLFDQAQESLRIY